jgi:hypothetical protein
MLGELPTAGDAEGIGTRMARVLMAAVAPPTPVPASSEAVARPRLTIGARWTSGVEWLRAHSLLRAEALIAYIACLLSVAAYAFYASRGLTLAYNDAISHMMIARRVVAGRTPGLAQLGTTWLPFNHMLMLPVIWIDALYRNGLAGTLPSMGAYVVAAVYLFRLGKLAFASPAAGWLAALVFMLNPNVLYMQSTPMSELDLLGLAILAVYYTVRWAYTLQPADLVKAAAAAAAGTLVRYDGWALVAALACIILYIAWSQRGRSFAESNLLLFGTLAFAGCAGWLAYNQIIFGDALAFLRGKYSSNAMQMRLAADGGLPTLHNPLLSLHVYAQATVDNNWLPLVLAALCGTLLWVYRARLTLRTLPLCALLVPFAFNWLSLITGNSALTTPEIPVYGLGTYYNVRYGLMMIPAVAVFFAYLLYRHRILIPAGLALLVVFTVTGTFLNVPYSLDDPLKGVVHTPWYRPAGDWLHDHYHGGNILISYAPLAPVMYYANVRDSEFITDANGAQFTDALNHPDQWAAWIVVRVNDPEDVVAVTLGQRQDWQRNYAIVWSSGPVRIYQRIDTRTPSKVVVPAPAGTPPAGPVNSITPTPTPIPTPRMSPGPSTSPTA